MFQPNFKPSRNSALGSLLLASSLAVAACSAETPQVTQVPPTLTAQVPEEGVAFYYDGVKTSITPRDAAVLFAACTLNTNDAAKIISFANTTLKLQPPLTAAEVTGLGDPLQPAISDFTGDGTVNCNDAAVLFAASVVGSDANKINGFIANTLKIPGINVSQTQLDSFFRPAPSGVRITIPGLSAAATVTVTCSDGALIASSTSVVGNEAIFAAPFTIPFGGQIRVTPAIASPQPISVSRFTFSVFNNTTNPGSTTYLNSGPPISVPAPGIVRITIPGLSADTKVTVTCPDGALITSTTSVVGNEAIFAAPFTIPFGGQIRVTPPIASPQPISVGGFPLTVFDNTTNPGSTTYFNSGPLINVN